MGFLYILPPALTWIDRGFNTGILSLLALIAYVVALLATLYFVFFVRATPPAAEKKEQELASNKTESKTDKLNGKTPSYFLKAFNSTLGIIASLIFVALLAGGGYWLYNYVNTLPSKPEKALYASGERARLGYETITVTAAENANVTYIDDYFCFSFAETCRDKKPDVSKKSVLVKLRVENSTTNPKDIGVYKRQFFLLRKAEGQKATGRINPDDFQTYKANDNPYWLAQNGNFYASDADKEKYKRIDVGNLEPGESTEGWLYFDIDADPVDYYFMAVLFPNSLPVVIDLKK